MRDQLAYRGGWASRGLGLPYERNPYPEQYWVRPELRAESSLKRQAWWRGWIEHDAKLRDDRAQTTT